MPSTNYHTPHTAPFPLNAAEFNSRYADLDQAITDGDGRIDDLIAGDLGFVQLNLGVTSTLTIASGAVTITRTRHLIDTEGAAASDDLETINGGAEGDVLYISIVNNARTVTVKHATGNIYLASAADLLADNTNKVLKLIKTSGNWVQTMAGGAGSGSSALELIDSDVVTGSSVASISITSIPGTYTTLILRAKVRSERASQTNDSLLVRFNNDTTAGNYRGQYGISFAATASAAENIGATATVCNYVISASTATANSFSIFTLVIPWYANTSLLKNCRWELSNVLALTTGTIVEARGVGLWNSTNAITRIDFLAANGNLSVGTRWALYGEVG